MDKIIYIKSETYALVRKYTELKNSQDKLCKSYEARLLELLLSIDINISEYKNIEIKNWLKTHEILEDRYPASLLTGIPFNVRDITLKYLCIYAFSHELFSLDGAICDCFEKEMFKKEIESETKLTNVLDAFYQKLQKRIEKLEGKTN